MEGFKAAYVKSFQKHIATMKKKRVVFIQESAVSHLDMEHRSMFLNSSKTNWSKVAPSLCVKDFQKQRLKKNLQKDPTLLSVWARWGH